MQKQFTIKMTHQELEAVQFALRLDYETLCDQINDNEVDSERDKQILGNLLNRLIKTENVIINGDESV